MAVLRRLSAAAAAAVLLALPEVQRASAASLQKLNVGSQVQPSWTRYRGGGETPLAAPALRKSRCDQQEGFACPASLLRGGGRAKPQAVAADPEGEMSLTTFIINLVADLCPHGMLPVAFGMAALEGTGLAIAPGLLTIFAVLSTYTLVSIGRACDKTKQWSFAGLWTELVGTRTAWLVEASIAVLAFGCCVFYSAFVGDLFGSLVGSLKSIPAELSGRAAVLCALSMFPILPLCLMKNLSALKYTSFGGLVAIFYTVGFVVLRSVDGTYAEGGKFFDLIAEKFRTPDADPWATVGLYRVGPGLVTLMNMASVAFMAHYNGVKYYEELEGRSVQRFRRGIGTAIGVSMLVFSTMMLMGFRTFGAACQPLLLNNYHRTDDQLAGLARLATGCAILCGYPLMFSALKTSFFNAGHEVFSKFSSTKGLASRFLQDKTLQTTLSVTLLAIITTIACGRGEEDIAIVVGLIGAVLGSIANFIIPAVLNLKLLKREGKGGVFSEASFNKLLLLAGVVFAAVGTHGAMQEGH